MQKPLEILFIEDDFIERIKFKRVLDKLPTQHKLQEAENGEDALQLLEARTKLPDIVILDLNMPKLNGIEFLRIVKKDVLFFHIPTVVFTTSNNQKDILECYKIGISSYLIKPLKFEEYQSMLKTALDYWAINRLI